MTMRLGLLIFGLCLGTSVATAGDKPNIVVILADDLGYGDVRCLNPHGKIATPHLDQLARAGMIFTDAHSSSAVCSPTRYGLMTGRYNWRSKLKSDIGERVNLAAKHPEIVERFTELLKKYIADGRSTPGARQENDLFRLESQGTPFLSSGIQGRQSRLQLQLGNQTQTLGSREYAPHCLTSLLLLTND